MAASGLPLILGARGQVGQALVCLAGPATALDRNKLDLLNESQVLSTLASLRPSAILNAAAYTAVDQAESDADNAHTLNARVPGLLGRYARDAKIPLIHYSTDCVFSGTGTQPWKETDPPDPVNTYGQTKREGEQAIEAIGGTWATLRTAWVFSTGSKNFFMTLLRLFLEKHRVEVVDDQVGSPTYAEDLAQATLKILNQMLHQHDFFPSGIYHLCNSGWASRYDYAHHVLEAGRKLGFPLITRELVPVPSSRFPTPATRPLNSRLDTTRAAQVLGVTLPPWQDAVDRALRLTLQHHSIS